MSSDGRDDSSFFLQSQLLKPSEFKMSSDGRDDSSFFLSTVNVNRIGQPTSGTVYLKHIVSQCAQLQSKLHAVLHKESFGSRLAGCRGYMHHWPCFYWQSLMAKSFVWISKWWYICNQMSSLNMWIDAILAQRVPNMPFREDGRTDRQTLGLRVMTMHHGSFPQWSIGMMGCQTGQHPIVMELHDYLWSSIIHLWSSIIKLWSSIIQLWSSKIRHIYGAP